MASKITSASEVNTGFLSSVSTPNLRQGLLEHFFECSHESEDDSSDSDVCSSIFFGQIQSRRLVKPQAAQTLYSILAITLCLQQIRQCMRIL